MAQQILSPLEQFERLDRVWESLPIVSSRHYKLGSFSLKLLFGSEALEGRLTRALEHLAVETPLGEAPASLTICLWDSVSTHTVLPHLEWRLLDRRIGYCEPPVYLHYDGTLSGVHTGRNRAYYVVQNAEALPWWISGSPLQIILNVWLREQGVQLTHTAAVGNGKRAVLLTGKGGSGKSTTTLSCLREGLYYLGEDYCCLVPGKTPQVWSIYQSAKWEPHTRKIFPEYDRFIANPEVASQEKALVYYRDFFAKQIQLTSPIQAILSLKVGGEKEPRLEKCDEKSSLTRLMMSTLAQLPLYHSRTMNLLKALVDQLEHYHLILGRDLKLNSSLIQQILEKER